MKRRTLVFGAIPWITIMSVTTGADAGYVVGLENSVTGPVLTPGGPLAENMTLKSSGNAFQLAFALGTRGI